MEKKWERVKERNGSDTRFLGEPILQFHRLVLGGGICNTSNAIFLFQFYFSLNGKHLESIVFAEAGLFVVGLVKEEYPQYWKVR